MKKKFGLTFYVDDVKIAKDLVSTPQIYAKANGRMNPAGISMFYCSISKELTIKEVVDFEDKSRKFYSTGYFKNKEDLRIVDFTNIPKRGSIFDENENIYIETLTFLSNFINDITQPINKNDSIIEYIPTQVVTEYMRFNNELNVDGIIYPSSKDKNLNNIVLFYNNKESLEYLEFEKTSIVTKKILYTT